MSSTAAIRRAPVLTELEAPTGSFSGGTLERRSLAEQVAARLMAMIKSGSLKPGDRLPTEQQMTIAFGISRPPLREALKALTLMGVIESRQGGRYSVTDLSPSRLFAPFNTMLSVAEHDLREQFEARLVVELELVRLCATVASPETRQGVRTLAAEGKALVDDAAAFAQHDMAFHRAINAGSGNGLLTALAQALYDLGLEARRAATAAPEMIAKNVRQHIAIADAIAAGDANKAAKSYRRHLDHIRDVTIQSITLAKQ